MVFEWTVRKQAEEGKCFVLVVDSHKNCQKIWNLQNPTKKAKKGIAFVEAIGLVFSTSVSKVKLSTSELWDQHALKRC